MNKTQKTIYQAHGIIIDGDKLVTPVGERVCPLLPVGSNGKVGDAGTWSIWHGCETRRAESFGEHTREVMARYGVDEITGSCPCHCEGCYCDAHRQAWDSNIAIAVRKLLLAKLYPDWTRRAIIAQILADGLTQVRVHAQGDFKLLTADDVDETPRAYAQMWADIVRACPGVDFWTYTKYAPALEALRGIRNMHITPSNTPVGINFGTCAELLERYAELTSRGYRVHVCACGTPYQKKCSDCTRGCKRVGVDVDYVLFIKHSTPDYKAGKHDAADYAALVELVRRQELA